MGLQIVLLTLVGMYICIDILYRPPYFIFLNSFSFITSKQIILHIHGFKFKMGKRVANSLYLHA